ncbi:hypothetical protein AB0K71_13425 [Streptomyces syringium]
MSTGTGQPPHTIVGVAEAADDGVPVNNAGVGIPVDGSGVIGAARTPLPP